jgi:hypothetical protein
MAMTAFAIELVVFFVGLGLVLLAYRIVMGIQGDIAPFALFYPFALGIAMMIGAVIAGIVTFFMHAHIVWT